MSVNKLKYFFAVDTKYVMKKLLLLMFPYTHQVIQLSCWSLVAKTVAHFGMYHILTVLHIFIWQFDIVHLYSKKSANC